MKKEMVFEPNRANALHQYILERWPYLVNLPGVWVVGSTAYDIANGKEAKGDLDLICDTSDKVELVAGMINPVNLNNKSYLGGTRVVDSTGRQVDIWSLKENQTIDDAVKTFGQQDYQSSIFAHCKVHYSLKERRLTVYPNDNSLIVNYSKVPMDNSVEVLF